MTQRRSSTLLVRHDSHRKCYQSDYTKNKQFLDALPIYILETITFKSTHLCTIEARNWTTEFDGTRHCILTLRYFDFPSVWYEKFHRNSNDSVQGPVQNLINTVMNLQVTQRRMSLPVRRLKASQARLCCSQFQKPLKGQKMKFILHVSLQCLATYPEIWHMELKYKTFQSDRTYTRLAVCHQNFINHADDIRVVKPCSNVWHSDSRSLHFSEKLDPNSRTSEAGRDVTLCGQLPSARSPTRRFHYPLLVVVSRVTCQTIRTLHMPSTLNTATA